MRMMPVLAILTLAWAGCGNTPVRVPSVTPPPGTPPEMQPVSGDDNLAVERLRQAVDGPPLLAQQNRAYAQNYFLLARRQYEAAELEVAAENLKLALRYDPGHREAETLLEQVQGLLGQQPDRVHTFFDWAVQERKVSIEQRQIEIRNLIAQGRTAYAAGDYAAARDKFETALRLIDWMPYGVELETERMAATEGLQRVGTAN
jgi:tetratricopeptide (TPR) repeat protein